LCFQLVRITINNKPYGINGLEPYRQYEIRIRAYTSFGKGPWSNVITNFTGKVISRSKTNIFSADFYVGD